MPLTYQVLTTPAFEKEFRKLVRKNPEIKKYLEQTVEILETDPQNVNSLSRYKTAKGR
jgi:mRNA-degrading endonuclease RelE of RelBE toxin-antitoxin system